ncbi:MAG: SLATT domain-containing protein [Actinobacteria bacterium]|nr:SLATT domain-containing protein [Actinomycetota bacterium]
MDNIQITTAEKSVSKTKEEIIKEAQRIEESTMYSSKGHFVAANFWTNFHLWIGIPMILLAAIAGAYALSQFNPKHIIAGIISIIVAALSSVMTFLNPNEKASTHLNAGNNYDSLQNKVRMFWSIDCWREESEQVLTERLRYFSELKDRVNQSSPQIPCWAYKLAKKGILQGESDYKVDKEKKNLPPSSVEPSNPPKTN